LKTDFFAKIFRNLFDWTLFFIVKRVSSWTVDTCKVLWKYL